MIELQGDIFRIGQSKIATTPRETLNMPGGYTFEASRFIGALEKSADWGIYHLPERTPTRIVEIVGNLVAFEKPISGNGVFIKYSRETEKIETIPFDCKKGIVPEISYWQNDTIVWVAGDQGADIISLAVPPFEASMEVGIEVDSNKLPDRFWREYHSCLQTK